MSDKRFLREYHSNWRCFGSKMKIFFIGDSKTVNDLPLGLDNIIGGYENIDLITPNWLRLERNGESSPAATTEVTGNPNQILNENK